MSRFDLKRVKTRRLALKLSADDMAKKLGFSNASVYWKYETGAYKINAEILPMLAKALECEVTDFFAYESSKTEINSETDIAV